MCQELNILGYKNIVGVDTSEEMIKRGNKEYPHLLLNHSQKIKLQYPDEHFDIVILCAVLTCIPNVLAKKEILCETYRLLKNGGILHLVEFCNSNRKVFESSFGIQMEHQKPSELRSLATSITKESKFNVIQTKTLSGHSNDAVSYFGIKKT